MDDDRSAPPPSPGPQPGFPGPPSGLPVQEETERGGAAPTGEIAPAPIPQPGWTVPAWAQPGSRQSFGAWPAPPVARHRGGLAARIVAIGLGAVLLFGAGSAFGRLSAPGTDGAAPAPTAAGTGGAATPPSWALLDQAWQLLEQNYADPSSLDPTTLVEGAIRGLMAAVNDPGHTGYLTAAEVKARDQSLSGTYVGIGATLADGTGGPTVVRVLPDSPAERAGVVAGDTIVAVDGTRVAGLTNSEVAAKVRGPEGTPVSVTLRNVSGTERTLTIRRAKLSLPVASWAFEPGTKRAVIRLESFSSGAADALVSAIKAAQAGGAQGIVLDLRGNPGGYVSEAVKTASQFLESGVVYISTDRTGVRQNHDVLPGGVATMIPLVVLVDGQTASAAEIVTGALQDAGRATVVGETTYGTGTVVGTYPLADGSAVTIGTERWLTPKGRAIWREGLTPDQVVPLAQGVAYLTPDGFAGLGPGGIGSSSDTQLQAALRALAAKEHASGS